MKKTKVILKGKLIKDDNIDASTVITGDVAVAIQLMVSSLVETLFDKDVEETGFGVKDLKKVIDKEYNLRKKEKENENSL